MPFNINTSCPSKVTLQGPPGASSSSLAVFQFPEHPATGVMRCVADSTGNVGQLTFEGTSVLIDLPTQAGLHLVTKPSSTDTDWQPRKQILPSHWVLPFMGVASSDGSSVTLVNADSGDQGFWLVGLPSSGNTNDVITVEVVGSIATFDATAASSGTFQGSFVVMDKSGQTSFSTKWSCSGQQMFQTNSPLVQAAMPLSVALSAAGTGLDCHVVPSLAVSGSGAQVSGVMRVTTSALGAGSVSVVSEAATPTS